MEVLYARVGGIGGRHAHSVRCPNVSGQRAATGRGCMYASCMVLLPHSRPAAPSPLPADDDASSSTSVNDVPADRELDRWLGEQQAAAAATQQQQQQQQSAAKGQLAGAEVDVPARAADGGEVDGQARAADGGTPPTPAPLLSLPAARRGAQGRRVRWAALEPPPPVPAAADGPAGGQLATPEPVQLGQQADGAHMPCGWAAGDTPGGAAAGTAQAAADVASSAAGEACSASPPGDVTAGASLPLTEEAVALLDQQLAAMEAGSPHGPAAAARGAQLQVCGTGAQLCVGWWWWWWCVWGGGGGGGGGGGWVVVCGGWWVGGGRGGGKGGGLPVAPRVHLLGVELLHGPPMFSPAPLNPR